MIEFPAIVAAPPAWIVAVSAVFHAMAAFVAKEAGETDRFHTFWESLFRIDIFEKDRIAYALIGGVWGAAAAYAWPSPAIGIFSAVLFLLAVADLKTCLVPVWGSSALFLIGILLVAADPWIALAKGISVFLFFYFYYVICEKWRFTPVVGFGDAIPIATIFAISELETAIAIAGLAAASPLVARRLIGKSPYIPGLYLAFCASHFVQYIKYGI